MSNTVSNMAVSWEQRSRRALVSAVVLVASTGVLVAGACNRRESEANSATLVPATQSAPDRIIYPESLHVDYAPVDTFIRDALATCLRGDYEAFRLLWSTTQDPLRREEFEQGWQAVKTIRIRAVEKVVLPDSEPSESLTSTQVAPSNDDGGIASDVSFVLLAEADFDTTHPIGKKQPHREIVLLVVREQNAWRLGRAPERIRSWIKSRAADDGLSTPDDATPAAGATGSSAIVGG